jgi:hypothetical protein
MLRKVAPLAVLTALVVAVLSWANTVPEAAAQSYPPPIGSLTVAASTTAPAVGANVGLSATLLDGSGNPIANESVTFTITTQPGNDASLGSLTKTTTTDANGLAKVTLYTGTTKGQIIVTVVSQSKTSQITLQAGGALPPTGEAPAERDGGSQAGWLIALIAGIALIAAGAGALAIRARRRV